jgi:hypothetical protein
MSKHISFYVHYISIFRAEWKVNTKCETRELLNFISSHTGYRNIEFVVSTYSERLDKITKSAFPEQSLLGLRQKTPIGKGKGGDTTT